MDVRAVTDWVILLGMIIPLAIRIFIMIGKATNNLNLNNLAARAEIIVDALEQEIGEGSNAKKKELALERLSYYAKEVGIRATPQQLGDYIEAAVRFTKSNTKK